VVGCIEVRLKELTHSTDKYRLQVRAFVIAVTNFSVESSAILRIQEVADSHLDLEID
jgi:hypothetical protein